MTEEKPDHAFTAENDMTERHLRLCIRCKGEKCILCVQTGREVERTSFQARNPDTYALLEQVVQNTHQYLGKEDLKELEKISYSAGKPYGEVMGRITAKIAQLAYQRGLEKGVALREDTEKIDRDMKIYEAEQDLSPLADKGCTACMGRGCNACGSTGSAIVKNANAGTGYQDMVKKLRGMKHFNPKANG